MRDALVFGINSNKARHDAFAVGNNLTFQQVYNFAKTEDSADLQMKMLEQQNTHQSTVHAVSREVRQKPTYSTEYTVANNSKPRYRAAREQQQQHTGGRSNNQSKGSCYNCGDSHDRDRCPAKDTQCYYCGIKGHFKRVCMNRAVVRCMTLQTRTAQPATSQLDP